MNQPAQTLTQNYTENNEITRKIQLLADRVQDAPQPTISALLEINQRGRKALAETKWRIDIFSKVMKALNHNAIEGKERFLDFPAFWNFETPKSFLLARSLERIKSAGLVNHLMGQADDAVVAVYMRDARLQAKNGSFDSTSTGVGLSDSLTKESFVILAYGLALSLAAIATEILWAYARSINSTL